MQLGCRLYSRERSTIYVYSGLYIVFCGKHGRACVIYGHYTFHDVVLLLISAYIFNKTINAKNLR